MGFSARGKLTVKSSNAYRITILKANLKHDLDIEIPTSEDPVGYARRWVAQHYGKAWKVFLIGESWHIKNLRRKDHKWSSISLNVDTPTIWDCHLTFCLMKRLLADTNKSNTLRKNGISDRARVLYLHAWMWYYSNRIDVDEYIQRIRRYDRLFNEHSRYYAYRLPSK